MPHVMFGGINHEPALTLATRLARGDKRWDAEDEAGAFPRGADPGEDLLEL